MKLIILSVGGFGVLFFGWMFFENKKIQAEVQPYWKERMEMIAEADRLELTTEEFLDKYKNSGEVRYDLLPVPQIDSKLKLSTILCNSYTISVFYSSATDGSAKLTGVSGNSDGIFCL